MNKIFFTLLFLIVAHTVFAQQLSVTNAESKVSFVIKNMGINVDGTLGGLKGRMQFDPKSLAATLFDITADVNTINTNNAKRDAHLKKDDFFDAAQYPVIRMVINQVTAKGGNNYRGAGTLTIKNVTRKISIDFVAIPNATGYKFTSSFKINRKDFGVGGSSMVMGDIVTVSLDVSAKK